MHDSGARFIRVVDADDSRVAEFRDIRERDLVGRKGRFIAEGRVVLNLLAASVSFEAEKILILDSRIDGMRDVLTRFHADIPIYVCSRIVIDRIAGFPMHRGILAVGRTRQPPALAHLLGQLGETGFVLVCAGISNHDNLGSLFRNAAAFGTDFVCLDGRCCDPLYRKAIRVSVGTVLTMPYARVAQTEAVLDALQSADFDVRALSPAGATAIAAFRPGHRVALVVGTEGDGLSETVLTRLQTLRVSQAPSVDSLNVAVAAGIALHHVASSIGRV